LNLIDLLILALLVFGALAGWRAGFLAPVLALGGGLLGFGVALLLATVLRAELAAIEQPGRALLTIAGLGMLVLMGEAAGAAIGSAASRSLRTTWFEAFDAAGGALVGVAHVLLLTWVLAGLLAAGMSPALAPLARSSAALGVVYERLPPASAVAGRLLTLLSGTELPLLFAGLEPPPAPPVDLPADADARVLADSAVASTARVAAGGCGSFQQVGSGFFVSPDHLVTNAHVVAGTNASSATLAGTTFTATVVLFDSRSDVALLYVPGANAPALELSSQLPERGTTGVALGYPGGGPLTLSPAGVTATFQVSGPDIYGEGSYPHSIVEIRSDIRRGNSGGPLLVATGIVGGMVFGESRTAADVGYAIAAPEVSAAIGDGLQRTQAVGTGHCS
jgi:S1-C subfamily serine protease